VVGRSVHAVRDAAARLAAEGFERLRTEAPLQKADRWVSIASCAQAVEPFTCAPLVFVRERPGPFVRRKMSVYSYSRRFVQFCSALDGNFSGKELLSN